MTSTHFKAEREIYISSLIMGILHSKKIYLTQKTLPSVPSTIVWCPVLHQQPSGVGLVPS